MAITQICINYKEETFALHWNFTGKNMVDATLASDRMNVTGHTVIRYPLI